MPKRNSMGRRCLTCIHWKVISSFDVWISRHGYRACKLQTTQAKTAGFQVVAETVFLQDDHIEPRCEFLTGPDFGCIHHLSDGTNKGGVK